MVVVSVGIEVGGSSSVCGESITQLEMAGNFGNALVLCLLLDLLYYTKKYVLSEVGIAAPVIYV